MVLTDNTTDIFAFVSFLVRKVVSIRIVPEENLIIYLIRNFKIGKIDFFSFVNRL